MTLTLAMFTDPTIVYPYTEEDQAGANALPKAELVATIADVLDMQRGDKTRLNDMRKPQLINIAARIARYIRSARAAARTPRPRKDSATAARKLRLALTSRKTRRSYTKNVAFRDRPGNIFYTHPGR